METMSKVRNLKEINSETYVEILHDEIDFNIENLYRISKSYSLDRINTVSRARDFEVFTIGEEVNINRARQYKGKHKYSQGIPS